MLNKVSLKKAEIVRMDSFVLKAPLSLTIQVTSVLVTSTASLVRSMSVLLQHTLTAQAALRFKTV